MINVVRTSDADLIKSCALRDDIYKTVAEDNINNIKYEPDFSRTCWLALYDGDVFIGYISFDAKNSVSVEMHIGIFTEFRGKRAYEATKLALIWLINEFPCYKKVIVFIPVIYKNVKIFAMKIGFKEEGFSRQSYLKGGDLVDQWFMGITQEEISNVEHS